MSNLRKFVDNYDWSGLRFPVSIKDIGVFETNNNISVNVLAVEGRDTAIKSLSRLLSSSNSKHKRKQYFCTYCLLGFTQELSRDEHYGYCIDNETVRVEMPKLGSVVEFYDGQNQFNVPFMMYADFEAILEPIQGPSPNPEEPYTSKVNQHILSEFCYYSKFAYGEVQNPLKLYRGKDCVGKFCDNIRQEAHRLYHMFPEKPMDPLTQDQWTTLKTLR